MSESEVPLPKPKRAYALEIVVDGDTKEDMMHILESLLEDLKRGRSVIVSGGVSSSGHFHLTINNSMTHEKYVKHLNAYLEQNPELPY